ncbi:MAG: hypothetical protein RMJ00_02545 [Nitrososphaerota archaeon]|nr:hypothetical protein [Candidatus Bathyarchaeota archaeon]MCX8162155.1 hypothetical protein [Candidatus Bathyarchaeota archaeon]MDW8061560.1 hypothetical protein [Nitrososphaerota archaeon]
MHIGKFYHIAIAILLPLLVLTGFIIGWFVGGLFDRLPRIILSSIGGIIGLTIGSLIIYVIIKRIAIGKAKNTRRAILESVSLDI